MLTLHSITEETKGILKWGVIIIGGFLLILILFNIGKSIKERLYPTPPPPPTVSFGKLPKTNFPKNATDEKLTYTLDTITGKLPVFSDRINVYKIKPPEPNLLALQNAKEKMAKIGFVTEPTTITQTLFAWSDGKAKKLTFDIISFNFTLFYDFYSDLDVIKATSLPNENQAIILATDFLSKISTLPSDIDLSKTKTTLFSIKKGSLVETSSLSTAQIIRVDLFQKDIDSLKIFYPDFPQSSMYFLIGGGGFEGKVVGGNFFHQNLDENPATYPIKTADEAFLELKNGKGFIQGYYSDNTEVSIKNVYLAYYLSNQEQNYIVPVIVFEGKNGFLAFVEAVKNEWLE
ncbi:MAG: hypothetical protein Q8P10_00635 [bacterium]|nr:hypothetical protein [bacterium]